MIPPVWTEVHLMVVGLLLTMGTIAVGLVAWLVRLEAKILEQGRLLEARSREFDRRLNERDLALDRRWEQVTADLSYLRSRIDMLVDKTR